jgi:hypothetical protein
LGKSFPEGPSPHFPPNRWKCPTELGGCGKEHSKPHFPYPKQIDRTKDPGELGRVRFNREQKGGMLDMSQRIVKKYQDKPGELYDKNGKPNPLACPHCGFTLDGILITKMGD